jgi:decaprenylphospho-beta-D-erythro-pentofuranosid-2-ulose 2-reductase
MRDALGDVQSVLVLGGNSEIANAVLNRLADRRLERVVLAARDVDTADKTAHQLRDSNVEATVVSYDATVALDHARALQAAGDVDVVLIAFGALGPPFDIDADPAMSADIAHVNFTAGVASAQTAAAHLRRQGHGSLVILSSVAGVRTRADNAVYGAAKAGLDAFGQALGDALHGSGVHVMVVRPGFVHTKMTAGMQPAPFSTTPERVAADIIEGLRGQRTVVWSPSILKYVFAVLRRIPRPLWRRLGQ